MSVSAIRWRRSTRAIRGLAKPGVAEPCRARPQASSYTCMPTVRSLIVVSCELCRRDRQVQCSGYSLGEEAWTPRGWQRIDTPGLIVYAHADGSFSVWDSRSQQLAPVCASCQSGATSSVRFHGDRGPWDGLAAEVEGRALPLCNGHCCMTGRGWVKAKDAMSKSHGRWQRVACPVPRLGRRRQAGAGTWTMRLSHRRWTRDIPSDSETELCRSGADPARVVAGFAESVALAYMLTWAWSEHRIAAEFTREKAVRPGHDALRRGARAIFIPAWQRSILSRRCGMLAVCFSMVRNYSSIAFDACAARCSLRRNRGSIQTRTRWLDLDLDGDPSAGATPSAFVHSARNARRVVDERGIRFGDRAGQHREPNGRSCVQGSFSSEPMRRSKR